MEESMDIKTKAKFKNFFKRYGVFSVAFICAMAIVLGVAVGTSEQDVPVSVATIEFSLPMKNAVVVKDFADDHLQFNASLNRWEVHLGIDLVSENENVFNVADGVVTLVENNSLEGCVVEISHQDGFVSRYSSLSSDLRVSVGDKVVAGENIAKIDKTASNESADGSHLHFVLMKNNVEIDPNYYLDLQNK